MAPRASQRSRLSPPGVTMSFYRKKSSGRRRVLILYMCVCVHIAYDSCLHLSYTYMRCIQPPPVSNRPPLTSAHPSP